MSLRSVALSKIESCVYVQSIYPFQHRISLKVFPKLSLPLEILSRLRKSWRDFRNTSNGCRQPFEIFALLWNVTLLRRFGDITYIFGGVAKHIATVKTQRCLSTKNISRNHFDQNGGYQNRDLRLIMAEGQLLKIIHRNKYEMPRVLQQEKKTRQLIHTTSTSNIFPPF